MKVAIVMGSKSDYSKLEEGINFLKKYDVEVIVRILSAHRTPKELVSFIESIEDEVDVIIAAAGKAAHLPGVIAASTLIPVVGLPIKSSTMDGMDSLLSMVQMPKGIPVATVTIDSGLNAALMASAAVWSASVMVNQIGYVISGLDGMDTIISFIIFCSLAVVGMILNIVASFLPVVKEAE